MPVLQVKEIEKKFGKSYALHKVSVDIEQGEVHALVGENGAGKSTLVKIITGVYSPDGGSIIWQGKNIHITSPRLAREIGINVIHQERHLVPAFNGMENLFLGLKHPHYRYWPGIRWKEMRQRAERLMDEFGIEIPLDTPASRMTPPERTLLEILRAMMQDCRLLILDEPTASLTDREAELLFQLIRKLQAKRTAVIYVSHRLDEIFKLSDRITVLRNGVLAAILLKGETDRDNLIRLMAGGKSISKSSREHSDPTGRKALLEIRNLKTADGKIKGASLNVFSGEIVGIFGLAGAGRTELLETVYGLRQKCSGEIVLNGNVIMNPAPANSLKNGMVLISEDRRSQGMVMGMSVRENMTLSTLSEYTSLGVINNKKELEEIESRIQLLKIKSNNAEQPVNELSGGNQQKVVFAKALMSKPMLFLCDEPTQAVDVMTRSEIHRLLSEQASMGCGVLYVSSDLQEVLEVSDRLIVMQDGETIADLPVPGLHSEQVLQLCYQKRKKVELSNDGHSNQ